MNIYSGPGSAYAVYEGVYAPEGGVDLVAAASIAALILRDMRRGWGYDRRGDRVKVTPLTAARRLRYLVPLCVKHGGRGCSLVRDLVERALATGRIPPEYAPYVRLEGRNAAPVYRELAARGIVPAPVKVRA